MGVDRKSSTHPQNDVNDPKRKFDESERLLLFRPEHTLGQRR